MGTISKKLTTESPSGQPLKARKPTSGEGDGDLGGFSNYGLESVDLAAPGKGIQSTFTEEEDPDLLYDCGYGTSYSAPYVTGAVGLLYSDRPNSNYRAIRNAILQSVDVLPGLHMCGDGEDELCVATQGRLNLFGALNWIDRGDFDADADVDLQDMAEFLSCLGTTTSPCLDAFDLDSSGVLDLADYELFESLINGPS